MRLIPTIVLLLGSTASAALAADFTDTAPVISATPITERVIEPRKECTVEQVPAAPVAGDRVANQDGNRSYTGAILGGVAGAILGNQVGKGRGNTAATAAGAIAGAMVGDRIDNRQTASVQPVEHCRTVETTREVVKGYTVIYRYNGRDVATTLPYDPGQTVSVSVGVVEEYRQAAAPSPTSLDRNGYDRNPLPATRSVSTSSRPPGNYSYRY